jgi:hypothetical protein
MDNSDEIKTILLNILSLGLLRIRALGNSGSAEQCSIEADHLHNLPHLIQSLNRDELLNYYTNEIRGFLRHTSVGGDDFTPQWERLGRLIGAVDSP